MIGKIVKGHDTRGLLHYLLGPGRFNEHTDPHIIAGADVLGQVWGPRWPGDKLSYGDEQVMADDVDRWFLEQRVTQAERGGVMVPRTKGEAPHVFHAILAVGAQEGQLGDDRWQQIAVDYVGLMGWEKCQWVAVHHGASAQENDHTHLVVNRVQESGRWVSASHDFKRSAAACRVLEKKYGLQRLADGNGQERGLPGYSAAEGRRAMREQTPGERYMLEQMVRVAATGADTEAEFVRALRDQGVRVRPRYGQGSTDQVVGYSVTLGAQGGDKQPVWFGGGRLAPDLTLPKLRSRWAPCDRSEALAAWQNRPHPAGSAASPSGSRRGDPAAEVDALVRRWQQLDPQHEAAWRAVASDTAAFSSALGQRLEQAHLVHASRGLARSAQGPGPRPRRGSAARTLRLLATASLSEHDGLAWAAVIESLARATAAVISAHQARGELVAAARLEQVRVRHLQPAVQLSREQAFGVTQTAAAQAAVATLAPLESPRVGPRPTPGPVSEPRGPGRTTKGSQGRTWS